MPLHVSSICAHCQEVKIVLYSIWYHHTYRWPSRHASTCFEHHVLIVMRSQLYYTASGIITPIGGRPVMPLYVSSTRAHRQEVTIVLYSLWYHHTYRWPSSHASICFEHMCSSAGGHNCTIQPLVSSHL